MCPAQLRQRTTTLKCLPCAAARLSSASTTREFPWVITTLPSRMKHSPSSAILARAFSDVAANVFPRSINQALEDRKSDESSAAVRVAYLRGGCATRQSDLPSAVLTPKLKRTA